METRHIYSAPERELTLQEWCKEFRVGTNLPTPTCDNAREMMKSWTVVEEKPKFNLLTFFFNFL